MDRQAAWELLTEYTQNESLLKHALAVEAAMRAYAGKLGGDPDEWAIVGLIHDFDNYLRILKAVHSGTDLETALTTARDALGPERAESSMPCSSREQRRLNGCGSLPISAKICTT